MNKFTKFTSALLSCFVLVSSLSGCNVENTTVPDNTASETAAIYENKLVSDKYVKTDLEYESADEFISAAGLQLRTDSFMIAKYFLQHNKEELKKYFLSEEDWEKYDDMYDDVSNTDLFANLAYFDLDHAFISYDTDEQGRNTVTLCYNFILEGNAIDKFDYVAMTMVLNDNGEWKTIGVGLGQ